ncbi:hypothetical protein RB195_003600 [Necator americanus]|uniref:Uncharacterized protein n=1 Tax=Necator americanus TaxID=51031 RepID=A0ABR1DPC0_NECAM
MLCTEDTLERLQVKGIGGELGKGDDYKLSYHGTSNRNGAGVILNETFKNSVTAVGRLSDCLMALNVDTGEVELRVVSAYAPQVGCSEKRRREGVLLGRSGAVRQIPGGKMYFESEETSTDVSLFGKTASRVVMEDRAMELVTTTGCESWSTSLQVT